MRYKTFKNMYLFLAGIFLSFCMGLTANADEDARIYVGVSYELLQPGEEYVHFHLKDGETASQAIAPETILYMDQGQADVNGRLSFHYAISMDTAGDVILRGTDAEDSSSVLWTLENQHLTISVNGEIGDVTEDSPAPWDSVKTQFTEMTFEEGITKIGASVFEGCTELKSITFNGEAPEFDENCFTGVTAQVMFYENDPTWTEDVLKNYGGDIQWIPIKVPIYVESIILKDTELTLEFGKTHQLETELKPENADNKVLCWASSDETVVSVDENGLITAVGIGEAEILVSSADDNGANATCQVIVIQKITETEEPGVTGMPQPTETEQPGVTGTPQPTETEQPEVTGIPNPTEAETVTPNPTKDPTKFVTEIFDDVYQDWYTEYVQYVYDNNLMTGIKGTRHFAPNDNITKAQVAQVLYNMEGQPVVKNKNVFYALNDVYESEWYANAVAWAYNTGVVTGDLNTKMFQPNANVTREQLALMLYRYAAYKNYNVLINGDLTGLANADKVSNWSEAGVRWAVGKDFISGIDKGSYKDLAPQGNATRAQMAAILMRFCEAYGQR